MNRTMVKRGVGAAALAIVAALLLGWLLKDKDQERQDIVDMKLPGAAEVQQSLNIPSLKGAGSDTTQTAGETVVASTDANGASTDVSTKETGVNTFQNEGSDLDFTIRPPKGEKREIIDNIGKAKENQTLPTAETDSTAVAAAANNAKAQQNSGAINRTGEGTVVASTEPTQKAYRPRLVEEKERKANYGIVAAEKQAAAQAKKQLAAAKAAEEKAAAKAKAAAQAAQAAQSSTGQNGYAIQLLATSSASRANNLKSIMSKEGYQTFVSKTAKDGKTLFRVRVGGYTDHPAAVKAQNSMKRRYQKNQYVNTSMVVAN